MAVDLEAAAGAAQQVKAHLPLLLRFVRWLNSRRYPKAPRNSFGLAIAITTEDDKQRQQIRTDFIQTLNDLLASSKLKNPLSLVVLPERLVDRIKTGEHVSKILKKTGCVLAIWGKARNRKIGGDDNYVLDLHSAVLHDGIPAEISQRLSREMSELLPARRKISRRDELEEFELNAASVELSARYVLGVAAHLSNQDDFSIEVFEDLQRRLKQVKYSEFPIQVRESLKLLKERVPIQLRELHLFKASQYLLNWRKTRDFKELELMMGEVTKAETYTPNLYQACILRALYYFVRDKNVTRARKEIAKVKKAKIEDATWALDEAFLLAYSGNMTSVPRYYRMGLQKLPTNSSVIIEIEEFILWVLSQEPEKKQLHFCLGLINYWGKGDLIKAREDFAQFISLTEDREFNEQRKLAMKYLDEITVKAT